MADVNTEGYLVQLQDENGAPLFPIISADLIKDSEGNTFDLPGLKSSVEQAEQDVATLQTSVDECFQSVSDGKTLIANAITGKGVTTSSSATFATMANNIGKIETRIKSYTELTVQASTGQTKTYNIGYKWRENLFGFVLGNTYYSDMNTEIYLPYNSSQYLRISTKGAREVSYNVGNDSELTSFGLVNVPSASGSAIWNPLTGDVVVTNAPSYYQTYWAIFTG